MAAPSAEDFEQWLENPVTRYVMAAAKSLAAEYKETWINQSWDGGNADRDVLVECKARADAYLDLVETPLARWAEINGDDDE